MKKLSVFVLMLAGVTCAKAQAINTTQNMASKHQKAINSLLHLANKHVTANKTTSGTLTERVIAQSTRDSVTGPLSDSVYLAYSYFRGSTYDYNDMIFPYSYPYAATPMFGFEGVFTTPQVLADNYMHWTVSPFTLSYGLYESYNASFDINNNLVALQDAFTDSVTNANINYTNLYNTSNQITQGNWYTHVGGAPTLGRQQFFDYDVAGRMFQDHLYEFHLGGWHMVERSTYAYDASSNLIQIDCYGQMDTTYDSILVENCQYINTYDGANRLLTVATSLFDGSGLYGSARDTFGYTGAYPFHTSWKSYQYDNINHYWAPMINMTKTLNGIGLPDTINIKGYDSLLASWVPQTLKIARYDAYNNPDTLFEYDYNYTAYPAAPNFTTVYYYDVYLNPPLQTGLTTTQACRVYPNPATSIVSIFTPDVAFGTQIQVAITNATGQTMMQGIYSGQSARMQIDINKFAPGNYWVTVQDNKGAILGRQQIVKE